MRLIASKVYRAFPELDAFDDAQCARFVAAANGAWGKVALRLGVIATVGIGLFVAGGFASLALGQIVSDRLRLSELGQWAFTAVPLAILGTLALVAGLVTRDLLLRLGVRGVISRCGLCWNCRYSLLGMPVAADCRITCPECGEVTTADPALGELSREGAATVYRPTAHRDDAAAVRRRRERRVRAFRRATRSAAAFALLLLATYGMFWIQALWARAEFRRAVADAAGVRASLRDPSILDAQAAERWTGVLRLTDGIDRVASGEDAGIPNPERLSLFPEALDAGMTDTAFASRWGVSKVDRVSAARFASSVVAWARRDGVINRLAEAPALVGATRPGDAAQFREWDWSSRLNLAQRLLRAELETAMNESDFDAYARALRAFLALDTIIDQQGVDMLWARRSLYQMLDSHLRRYPDDRWVSLVANLLQDPPCDDPDVAARYALADAFYRASLADAFADPHLPFKRLIGITEGLPQEYLYGPSPLGPGWPGTLLSNTAACTNFNAASLAAERSPPGKRSIPAAPTAPPLAARLTQWSPMFLTRRWAEVAFTQRVWLSIRVERFRVENGRLPTSLREAIGQDAPQRWLIDELTAQTLVLVPRPPVPPASGEPPALPFDIFVESAAPPADDKADPQAP